MSVETVTKLIVKRLNQILNKPVVPTDNTGKKLDYPFLSYKVTTARSASDGEIVESELVASANPLFEFDIKETAIEQPTFTVSFTAYAAAAFDASGLVLMALDALKHSLYYELKDVNAVVVNIEAVGDRTIQIVDHYEYRYGFDAIIRIATQTSRIVETMEEIKLGGTTN